MARFLGKPGLESFPNAAKKGLKIFTDQQIRAVSGYERLYRIFWNRKAEELCRSPSFAKWSKTAITGVIVTEWSLKKTALLFNHSKRLIDKKHEKKGKQKSDTVYPGSLSMLNEHKSLLRLDEQLRSLKRPDNTTRDKKQKIQALEELMQGRMTELKKRQEALRKGLENMAKEKEVNNKEIVGQMDVNTTQLDSATIKELINTIMPQDEPEEGCSGVKGPDQGPDDSDSDPQEGCSAVKGPDQSSDASESDSEEFQPVSNPSDPSDDEGEHSPSRKRVKLSS